MQHTAGPWEVTSRPDGLGGQDVIVKAGTKPICDCFQGLVTGTAEEEQANARLIAAVPELLRAVKIAHSDWYTWKDVLRTNMQEYVWEETANVLEQVIAAVEERG